MRVELDELKDEFDRRGRWAQSLERKVGSQETVIRRLAEENAALRETAGIDVAAH